jgi:acyl carrier protein
MLDNQTVKTRITEVLNVSPEKVKETALLQELVMDSFILIDLVIDLQNTFNVRLNQEDLTEVKSVGDLISVLQAKAKH